LRVDKQLVKRSMSNTVAINFMIKTLGIQD